MATIDDKFQAIQFSSSTSRTFDQLISAADEIAVAAAGSMTKLTRTETEPGRFAVYSVKRLGMTVGSCAIHYSEGPSGNRVQLEVLGYVTIQQKIFIFIPLGPKESAAYKPIRSFSELLRQTSSEGTYPSNQPSAEGISDTPISSQTPTAAAHIDPRSAPVEQSSSGLAWTAGDSQRRALGVGMVVLGGAAFLAAMLKFRTGYYPSELIPYLAILAAGAGLIAAGSKVYRSGTPTLKPGPQPPSPAASNPVEGHDHAVPLPPMPPPVTVEPTAAGLDPATTAAQLQQITADSPHLRAAVAAHPNAYPDLLEWLRLLGDPSVDLALASRQPQVQTGQNASFQPAVMQGPRPAAGATASGPSRRRRWVLPTVASVAVLSLVAVAAVALPKLLSDHDPAERISAHDGDAAGSPAAEDDPAVTFADGAQLAWQADAADLVDPRPDLGEPEFMYLVFGDAWISSIFYQPIDAGDVWVTAISYGDWIELSPLTIVGIDQITGEKRWEFDGSDVSACETQGDRLACVFASGSSPGTFRQYDPATGEVLSESELPDADYRMLDIDGDVAIVAGSMGEGSGGDSPVVVFDAGGNLISSGHAPLRGLFAGAVFSDGLLMLSEYRWDTGFLCSWLLDESGTLLAYIEGSDALLLRDGTLVHRVADGGSVEVYDRRVRLLEYTGTGYLQTVETSSGEALFAIDSSEIISLDPNDLTADWSIGTVGYPTLHQKTLLSDDGERLLASWPTDGVGIAVVSYRIDGSGEWEFSVTGDGPLFVQGDVVGFQEDRYDNPGKELRGFALNPADLLWSLDISGLTVLQSSPRGLIASKLDENYESHTLVGILPAHSNVVTGSTDLVAAPSYIPSCEAGLDMLAWAEFTDGWVCVCGTLPNAAASMVGETASGAIQVDDVTFDENLGRYSGSRSDGSIVWLDHTPATFGIRSSTGVVSTQTSVESLFFAGIGEGGEAQGVGAFDVTAPEHTAEDQVRYFSEILRRSEEARASLSPAVIAVRTCENTDGDYSDEIATITTVRDNRSELLAAIHAAPVDLIPEGTALVSELSTALAASYNADVAFLAWAQDVHDYGCGAGDESPGTDYSNDAGAAKEAFAARWNSIIAPAFGVATVARETL